MRRKFWNLILGILGFFQISAAAVVCPPNPSLSKNLELIQKVHMVGGEDRVSLKPFARSLGLSETETKKMFAATGFIKCGNVFSTVQLSGRKNLVTTAAHAIMYPDSCRHLNVPCEIKFPFSSKPDHAYKIKSGSWKDGGCSMEQKKTDWAVFELDADVDDATPYEIPEADHYVNPPKTVLKVASRAHNFRPTEGEEREKHNYNFEVCRVRHRDIYPIVNLHTDCDNGHGSSGAGELVFRDNKYYLTSITVSQTGVKPSGSDYDPRDHFNISVALEGDFLRELNRRMGR